MERGRENAAPLPPHPDLPQYYAGRSAREPFVRRIFDDTAIWYERLDGVLSFGQGVTYRRKALQRAGFQAGTRLLDVATGTGIVARAAASLGDAQDIVGLDPSMGMLVAGRRENPTPAVQAFGETLPFRDLSFDLISIGYALRHLPDLRLAFREFHRVLRPRGRLLILEITRPKSKFGNLALGAFMGGVIPVAARLLTSSRDAATLMRYYWETTRDCVPPETIKAALRDAGFVSVEQSTRYGIMTDYSAASPRDATP